MSDLYRKKPIPIHARQFDGSSESGLALMEWCQEKLTRAQYLSSESSPFNGTLMIETLEGKMVARPGDWIIRGVHGEHYPCRQDIFAETYEPVPEDEQ